MTDYTKLFTPSGFAFAFLRASLITLVSIKYTRRFPFGLDALEIGICADVGHRSQHFAQTASARAR
jgi:hypothetical protein